jgi:hypothetical protein
VACECEDCDEDEDADEGDGHRYAGPAAIHRAFVRIPTTPVMIR